MRNIIKLSEEYTAIAAHFVTDNVRSFVVDTVSKSGHVYCILPTKKIPLLVNLDYSFPVSPLVNITPYIHQKMTTEFIVHNDKCCVFNSQGAGKSLSALWAVDYLMNKKKVKNCLIVAPKTTLFDPWVREISTHFPKRNYKVLVGTAAKRKKLIEELDIDFHIINHDGIAVLALDGYLPKYDMIIYDEATALKSSGTGRFKTFFKYLQKCPQTRLVLMTGTPTPESPVDAFSLIKLVNPNALKELNIHTSGGFKARTMYKVTAFKWVPQNGSAQLVSSLLQPAVRFTLEDAIDMPAHTKIPHQVELSKEQVELFKALKSNLEVNYAGSEISAVNAAVLRSKMLQIFSGSVKTDDGGVKYLDCSGRYEALKEIIEEAGDVPIVVFTLFKATQLHLSEKLTKDFGSLGTIECINGDVSNEERTRIIQDFEKGKVKVLCAHPRTTAHGVSLTKSNVIVYWSPIDSNELYLQSLDRIRRLSSKQHGFDKFLVYQLWGHSIERKIFENLDNNKSLTLNEVLTLIRNTV